MELTPEEEAEFRNTNAIIDLILKELLQDTVNKWDRKYRMPNNQFIIATNDKQREYMEREFFL